MVDLIARVVARRLPGQTEENNEKSQNIGNLNKTCFPGTDTEHFRYAKLHVKNACTLMKVTLLEPFNGMESPCTFLKQR